MPKRAGKVSKPVKKLLDKRENAICADCDSKFIKSADITFAVFLCRECGEGHKKKVPNAKIVATTQEWRPEWIALFKSVGGNTAINSRHYESNIHNYDGRKRPTPSTRFIYDKYKWRFFCHDKKWMPSVGANDASDDDDSDEKKQKKKKKKKHKTKSSDRDATQVPAQSQALAQDDWGEFTQVMPPPTVAASGGGGGDDWGDFTATPTPVQTQPQRQPQPQQAQPPVDDFLALALSGTAPQPSQQPQTNFDPFQPAQPLRPTQNAIPGIMNLFDNPSQTQPQQPMFPSQQYTGNMNMNTPLGTSRNKPITMGGGGASMLRHGGMGGMTLQQQQQQRMMQQRMMQQRRMQQQAMGMGPQMYQGAGRQQQQQNGLWF